MIVAIDAGNSRSKWKAWRDGKVISQGSFVPGDGLSQALQDALSHHHGDCRVMFASVAEPAVEKQLRTLFTGCRFDAIKSSKACLGVTSSYAEPDKLGVDRWLAIIEAWHDSDCKACCIIDVGTAATLDVVDSNGMHAGGYIVPGLSLMKQALNRSTERVNFAEAERAVTAYGNDTTSAVHNGIHAMLLAWLDHEIARFYAHYKHGAVYITGGDAGPLLPHLADKRVIHSPDLVLDALYRLSLA